MTRYWNTCRFCDAPMSQDLVKYGTRHYAHYECYLKAGKDPTKLRSWQVEAFPYFLLKKYGWLEKVENAMRAAKAP